MIKINVNYFVISTKLENLKYFLRRGHFFALLWDRFKWHFFPRLNIVPSFPQTVDIETFHNIVDMAKKIKALVKEAKV